ncbi:hypothetical protein O181_083304 [Austropuccinia psidii MF-1]|uniref:Uncharacterized protein n=1 Tax=Austropuccinia psidii MF-1 TaxID=1389203 RepID=A0A9Q3FRB5_9BASI|nr:hypothetical protein [Austropuccinia psidii MF-1]
MARGPRSVGQLGPFWPNPMRRKGAKGGSHLAPKARWVPNHTWTHLSQNGPSIPWTQNGQRPSGHQFGHKSRRTHFWPWTYISAMASGNHQRPPD